MYFLGIGGVAMGQAAILMRALGHEVSGSDQKLYPPMSHVLRDASVQTFEGYDAARLVKLAPDLVVVGNAFSRGNAEVEWLLSQRTVAFTSLPALLREHLLLPRRPIVITGTHGKTTTTALCAHLLQAKGLDAGWFIGGAAKGMPSVRAGAEGAPFVIEGDEYDSAFFDKRSKFIHYAPEIVVCNNLEFDHADIFRDLPDIQRSFRHLLRLVPHHGFVLLNGDDPNLCELLPAPWTNLRTLGTGDTSDFRLSAFQESSEGSSFTLSEREGYSVELHSPLPGEYNARNAAMAFVAAGLAIDPGNPLAAVDPAGLTTFAGVQRRHEVRFASTNLTVVEDFAHHPTAVHGVVQSLRARFPEHRLLAAFEPRSATACLDVFQELWVEALADADEVILGAEFLATKPPVGRLDARLLARDLSKRGTQAYAFDRYSELLDHLCAQEYNQPTLLVFFSNGAFGGILPMFLDSLKK